MSSAVPNLGAVLYHSVYFSVTGVKAKLPLFSKKVLFCGPVPLALSQMKNYTNEEIIIGFQTKSMLNT